MENGVYSNKPHSIIRVYKIDHNAPKKFKSNSYKKYSKKPETGSSKYEKAKSEGIKEALEDAELNYYGLDDYLTKDKKYNQVFKKYYDEVYYGNVDRDKEPKELSVFDEITKSLVVRKLNKSEKDLNIIKEATKEALEDAEINYYGLDDYLTGDKRYNKIFKKYYDEVYYENVDEEKAPKELSIFDEITL